MNTQWKDSPRADLKLIPIMAKHGWEVQFHRQDEAAKRVSPANPPQHPVSFNKGETHVWQIKSGWMVATVIKDKYQNHRTIKDPFELVKQEWAQNL